MIIYTKIISDLEQQQIYEMFHQLLYENSYYTHLQLLYNNNKHFTTVSVDKNLCSISQLYNIAQLALSKDYTIFVEGTIHTNNHLSNVLINSKTKKPLFVKDTYIRVSIDHIHFMHILMAPPIIETPYVEYYYFNELFLDLTCDKPVPFNIIPPIFTMSADDASTNIMNVDEIPRKSKAIKIVMPHNEGGKHISYKHKTNRRQRRKNKKYTKRKSKY